MSVLLSSHVVVDECVAFLLQGEVAAGRILPEEGAGKQVAVDGDACVRRKRRDFHEAEDFRRVFNELEVDGELVVDTEGQEPVVIRHEHFESGLLADGGEEVLVIVNGRHGL